MPVTNNPTKKMGYDANLAAGIKSPHPNAIISKPVDIPFLNPIFFKTMDEGIAISV